MTAASYDTLGNPYTVIITATCLHNAVCDAIYIVADVPDEEDEENLAQYRSGQAVDAIAGANAVILHLDTRHLFLPCGHAPALPPLNADPTVAPKSVAEEVGYSFLVCWRPRCRSRLKLISKSKDSCGTD